ncbi:hypothetical protein EMILIAHAH_17 [Bacillus phage vB_BanH_Emiliahah]|nr:hypothetical protein EMILIAHAH_17 [Bacillus phage vB_BanH_Emiliahah]
MESKKYEYKKVLLGKLADPHYHGNLDVDKLQELGNEGWQFITISSGECIFMRERTEKHPLADVRPAVAWFAEKMEEQLKKNDYKQSWYDCDLRFLQDRMERKAVCFDDNITHHGMAIGSMPVAIATEASHIANYAMMLATRAYQGATGEKL